MGADSDAGSEESKGWFGVNWTNPNHYFKILVAVNFLNYLDRGIIPGATNEFNSFITDNVDTDKPDVFLGLLQSSFIVGFSLASIYFGNAVHTHRPFLLVSVGLSIWTVAVFLCGLAYYAESYPFLAIARMLSGVGEASFQCSMPPWITRYAGPGRGGTWLAIFYTAIPVGTACGYAYSAGVAGSAGWQWAFWIEGMAMVPFCIFFYLTKHYFKRECDMLKDDEEKRIAESDNQSEAGSVTAADLVSGQAQGEAQVSKVEAAGNALDDGEDPVNDDAPSVWDELCIVIKSPIYVLVTLGYAAQTGSLIGLSTFGSSFIMGLGFYDSEQDASTMFGVVISLAGIIGTPLGGIMMDKWNRSKMHGGDAPESVRLGTALTVITCLASVGCVLMCLLYLCHSLWLWMFVVCIGCGIVFGTSSGINIACMLSVHPNHRSFAIAFMTVVMHGLGDVPSPIISGLLKDTWAPGCVGDDDEVASSSDCRDDKEGIRLTMLVVTLWLVWTALFFFAALQLYLRSYKLGGLSSLHEDDPGSKVAQPLLKEI